MSGPGVGIVSCWPPSVAAGSGTTVSQQRLVEALATAGVAAELVYTSSFATSPAELENRRRLNASLNLDRYQTVLGIDGEGWLWAPKRRVPYVAFCEAVLVEVLPFESSESAQVLRAQAEWEGAAAQTADAVVVRSQFAAARVTESYGVPRDRLSVVPIPFDIGGWQASLPALPKEPLVLGVGHLYARKNYRALLEAWPVVAAARPEARLVIVGTGPESAALRRRAGALPSVTLAGHLPFADLLELHAEARVFCHPSLQENFGIAPVEGLASGANLVIHHHPAMIENAAGISGVWAVDARHPSNLAQALIEALDAPAPVGRERLDSLRVKLDPVRIGRQLRALLEACR